MLHMGLSKDEAMQRAVELLQMVGISEPKRRLAQYPTNSQEACASVMIAMALACTLKY